MPVVDVHSTSPIRDAETLAAWLQVIRGEYSEIPGLQLTRVQACRLWNLDAAVCDAALTALERTRFLRRTRRGEYVKA
jgi:hypothetical protein